MLEYFAVCLVLVYAAICGILVCVPVFVIFGYVTICVSLICNFCLSVAARTIVWAGLRYTIRYTRYLLDTQASF